MENRSNTGKAGVTLAVVAILGSFLLIAFLVKQMVKVAQPGPIGLERGNARSTDNAAIKAAGANALQNWGYVDQGKGVVRMPIEEAMKATVQGYKNAGAFHSNMVARVDKATAAPPKPPEKPSEYE